MNATLQQFFMTAAFRRAVLSHVPEAGMSEAESKDNIMLQLQRQFAHLQESERMFFVPVEICHAIKDYEGRPTNTLEQKDVPEFLTKLFADLETQLQGTRLATLAKDVFGLTMLHELIAEDPRGADRPRLHRPREDDSSYFLQMSVKNIKSLPDALAAYVSGETVDLKWELPADPPGSGGGGGGGGGGGAGGGAGASAGGAGAGASSAAAASGKPAETSLKTTKRVSIKSAGASLMLHLNRFEFDMTHMAQVKVNDRFEFPVSLDLWPYTIYGRPDAAATNAAAVGKTATAAAAAAVASAAAAAAAAASAGSTGLFRPESMHGFASKVSRPVKKDKRGDSDDWGSDSD